MTPSLLLGNLTRLAAALVALAIVAPAGAQPLDTTSSVRSSAGLLRVETLAALEFPWGMDELPDGRLLVTEKPGRLVIWDGRATSAPIRGLPEVEYEGQGGLLDVAAHPGFADNGWVYLYYVEAAARQPADPSVEADPRLGPYVDTTDTVLKGGVVLRGRLEGDRLVDTAVLWRQTPYVVGLGHYGGRLRFAPDGTLVVTSGERQSFDPAQDPASNLGKVIRLRDDGSVPDDNPFAAQGPPRDAVYSSGHRNPLGAAYRPGTDELWVVEMGPLHGDELNRIEAGGDYGWPAVSNGEHYNRVEIPHHETDTARYARPDFYWRPAISPAGLAFYRGAMFPEWEGDALIGGLSSRSLTRVDFDDAGEIQGDERLILDYRIRDVHPARDGAIYLLTDRREGALLRVSRAEAE